MPPSLRDLILYSREICAEADSTELSETAPFYLRELVCLADKSSGTFVARSLIDITALDLRIQEALAQYGNIKDFHVVLRRDKPDAMGCNWNARIDRVSGVALNDSNWWDVLPELRERSNLR